MNPEEQTDIDILKAAQLKEKLSTIDYMIHLSRCPTKELVTAGYRSGIHGDAYTSIINTLNGKLKKLVDSHIKKYPDDK